jgi:hypothetical protein
MSFPENSGATEAPESDDHDRPDEIDRGIEAIELPDVPRSIVEVESVRCSGCGHNIVRYIDNVIARLRMRREEH